MRASHHRYTFEDYVALEQSSPVKHEFHAGEIFAMAGGTPEHAALAAAVIGELISQLKGRPSRTYTSDLSVKVEATGLTTYPDATVTCGELRRDPVAKNIVLNPTVIVEVTSDSTESWDRTGKFDHYRSIPDLKEYVLVSHRERLLEVFRRRDDGAWHRFEARTGTALELHSIGCRLDVDAIYASS